MLSRKLLILFTIILFTILQSTVLNYIQIFKTKPDILLILVIFFSLNFGRIYGLSVGAICGFFGETTSGFPSGSLVFVFSLGGLILGHIGRLVYNQRILGKVCISFISTFIIYFFLFLLLQSSNTNLPLFNTIIFIILPASIYTAAVSPVIFSFLNLILQVK